MILLDVLMPRLNGWQTLRTLKESPETRNIPVVILSVVENRAFGFSLGAVDYLVKPLARGTLFSTSCRGPACSRRAATSSSSTTTRTSARSSSRSSSAAGYRARAAAGGAEALAELERERPSAVLLDLMMPPPDGFEVLYRIRERPGAGATVPVIVVTAKELTAADYARLSRVGRSGSSERAATRAASSARSSARSSGATRGLGQSALRRRRSRAADACSDGDMPRQMARILVVEDSPDIRELVRMLLEARRARGADGGGRPGGRRRGARERRPDLVLMDLSLPVLSGWEATREIKADPGDRRDPGRSPSPRTRCRGTASGRSPPDATGSSRSRSTRRPSRSLVASFLGRRGGSGGPRSAEPRRAVDEDPPAARILVVDDQPEVARPADGRPRGRTATSRRRRRRAERRWRSSARIRSSTSRSST